VRTLERFPAPWSVKDEGKGFIVVDARGVYICGVAHREDLHMAGWTLADKYLSRKEAEALATAISKLE
jgi:hypothetical protein